MISLYIISLLFAKSPDTNPWGKVLSPIQKDSAQIYGSYTSGCIFGGEKLPLKGEGYEVVNSYRNRYYAHPSLAQLIRDWGKWARNNNLGTLVVGDIAQPAGGPLTGDHKSHQIGLDVDLRLHLLPPKKKIKNRNDFNSTDVVNCKTKNKTEIDYRFFAEKWPISSTQLLQKVASESLVERIFVSAGIKKYLCDAFPDHPQWLKKIRPEWGHTSHFHVRLDCPSGMTSCKNQSPIPLDPTDTSKVGCSGEEYLSWFKTTPEKIIRVGCYPKSKPEAIPYWKQVVSGSRFPEECKSLVSEKASSSNIVDHKDSSEDNS